MNWSWGSGVDLVELQGVVHLALAEVGLVEDRGDVDVGRHALDLGALAVGPVELLDRQLQGPQVLGVAAAELRNCGLIGTMLCTVPLPKVLESPMIRPRP